MQDIKVVIGANFGDEGKGLMTDYFAAGAAAAGRKTIVVCSNGGAQRGHTVTTPEGVRHVFHHFGSGTLAGADTWLPSYFIVNPMIFMDEFGALAEEGAFRQDGLMNCFPGSDAASGKGGGASGKGSGTGGNRLYGTFTERSTGRIFMDPECPVSTPYDMITNQILEESRGNGRHGSCGIGIWETLLRDGKRLGELADMTDAAVYTYLKGNCRDYMQRRLAAAGINDIPEKWRDILNDEGLIENYIYDLRQMSRHAELRRIEVLREYDRIIFENGQGLLLDRCRREYGCNTTPSNTGFRNPAELIREYIHMVENVYDNRKKPYTADTAGNGRYVPKNLQNDRKDVWREEHTAYSRRQGAEALCRIDVEVCYVTRTYLTRHGAGRFDEECDKAAINETMQDLTNVPNPHQGTIRYGILDETALLRRIREDYDSERLPAACRKRITLAVTHVNEAVSPVIRRGYYISDGETRASVKSKGGRSGDSLRKDNIFHLCG